MTMFGHTRLLYALQVLFFISPQGWTLTTVERTLSTQGLNLFRDAIQLAGWLSYTGLVRNITVFVPENDAFEELSYRTRRMMLEDTYRLYELVANHFVLHRNLYLKDFYDGQKLSMGYGAYLLINVRKNDRGQNVAVWISGKRLVRSIDCSNGMIHTINGLITTPSLQLIEFMQHYFNHLGAFEQLLQKSRILYPADFTIFIPINACFKKKSERWLASLVKDPNQLKSLVTYHIIPSLVFLDPLNQGGNFFNAMSGKPLIIQRRNTEFKVIVPGTNATANIITPDLRVRTAIIHIIDDLLVPSDGNSVMSNLQDSQLLSTFNRALVQHGLAEILEKPGVQYTVFAPKDSAFDDLPTDIKVKMATNATYMQELLRNHIRVGKMSMETMKDYTQVQTLSGERKMLRKYGDEGREQVMIDDVLVGEIDREVSNGVIHFIDGVLIPRTASLWDIVLSRDANTYGTSDHTLSFFQALVNKAGLNSLISRDDYYKKMVWAPSDQAFRKLTSSQMLYLMEKENVARDVIRFHVTPGYFPSNLMQDKWIYVLQTMFKREKVRCRFNNGELLVFNPGGSNAKAVERDIATRNGLLNIIDEVLIPKQYASIFN